MINKPAFLKALAIALIIFRPIDISFSQAIDEKEGGGALSKLEEISQKVELESQELDSTTKREAQLNAELAPLEESVRKLQAQEVSLKKDLEIVRQAADTAKKDLEFAESEMAALKQITLIRLRTLYMNHSPDLISRLMLIADETHMERNAYFFTRIREHDTQLMNRFVSLKEAQQNRFDRLNKALSERAKIESKIQAQRTALKERMALKEDLLISLRQQKAKISDSISKLRAQALRLETVVVSLTGSESESARSSGTLKDATSSRPRVENYDGPGLENLLNKLTYPVQGTLIKSGSSKNSFGEMVTKKGVVFEVASASSVNTVAPGRVIFTGRMPGIGSLVIIDHGKRYYSLYGRLSEILVKLGDDLWREQQLGKSTTETPSHVYFEIRKNGISEDPKRFFKVK